MQCFRVLYHVISQESLVLSIHICLKASAVYTEKEHVTSEIFHERALRNCFILCQRKYIGQEKQCDIRAAHDGKVRFITCEYTTALLCSDWLYFPQHGIRSDISALNI